ncbi:MAG: LysE family transporter [Spirochaetia bacterium]|nr:LysE family transporter [Spirochaetia bacterium]
MEIIIIIITAIITGIVISLPVGPINLTILTTSAKHGARFGFSIGLGAAVMDIIYMLMALLGLSLIQFSEEVLFYIEIAGILFIAALGIIEILYSEKKIKKTRENLKKTIKKRKYFLMGLFFYISNPAIIAAFAGIGGWIKSVNLYADKAFNNVIFSIFVGIGSALWFGIFANLVRKFRKKMSEKILINISHGSGYILIGLSFYLALIFYKSHYG